MTGEETPLGYLVHSCVVRTEKTLERNFTEWLVKVLSSPLSDELKCWFLLFCQDSVAQVPVFPNVNSAIIANCLANHCPDNALKSRLIGACKLPQAIERFCQRKSNQYGIYVCTSSTLAEMKRAELTVETVDLSSAVSSGSATLDELYLRVLSCFSFTTCFAYVHGLEVIDDLFLKWCCEVKSKPEIPFPSFIQK
jgi:hypothetical protein